MRKFKVAQMTSSRAVKPKFRHSKLKPYTVHQGIGQSLHGSLEEVRKSQSPFNWPEPP